jgi:hypothetical protein
MCIIAEEIESVKNTKIFCGLSEDRQRQIVVYANEIANLASLNAMILPVLNPESIQFHDLTDYKEIFHECSLCFKSKNMKFGMRSKSNNFVLDCDDEDDCLDVIDVGSYSVSVAPTLNDLKRVDESIFTMDPDLEETLGHVYKNSSFGFIICALKPGNQEYHPLAYSTDIYQNKVFVPTLHYHKSSHGKAFGNTGDWSHEIYLHNIEPSSTYMRMNSSDMVWRGPESAIRVSPKRLQFPLATAESFTKLCIEGEHKNCDIICRV